VCSGTWPTPIRTTSTAILGWSGGGPYALATAYLLGDRVSQVGLVASMAPLAGTSLTRDLSPKLRRRARIAHLAPGFLRIAVARDRRAFLRDPAGFLEHEFARDLNATEPPSASRASRRW
jgi:pimeloyl-ACP methyl ester carboxylesterase